VKNFLSKIFIFSLAFSLLSCASNTPRENKLIGTATGGAAGAALGAASGPSPGPITLVGTGAFIGALIGFSYGDPMENSDKEKAFKAIADGKTATWQNPNTKVFYSITPAAHCLTFDGNPNCRLFTAIQTAEDGNTRKIVRTACKGSRGTWALVH